MRCYISKLYEGINEDTGGVQHLILVHKYCLNYTAFDFRSDIKTVNTGVMFVIANPTEEEHVLIKADPDIVYVPIHAQGGVELNEKNFISDISPLSWPKVVNRLEAIGVPVSGIDQSRRIRALIRRVCKRSQIIQLLGSSDKGMNVDISINDSEITMLSNLTGVSKDLIVDSTYRNVLSKLLDRKWRNSLRNNRDN